MSSPTISLITEGPFMGIIGARQRTIIMAPPLPQKKKKKKIRDHLWAWSATTRDQPERKRDQDCSLQPVRGAVITPVIQWCNRGEPYTKGPSSGFVAPHSCERSCVLLTVQVDYLKWRSNSSDNNGINTGTTWNDCQCPFLLRCFHKGAELLNPFAGASFRARWHYSYVSLLLDASHLPEKTKVASLQRGDLLSTSTFCPDNNGDSSDTHHFTASTYEGVRVAEIWASPREF